MVRLKQWMSYPGKVYGEESRGTKMMAQESTKAEVARRVCIRASHLARLGNMGGTSDL